MYIDKNKDVIIISHPRSGSNWFQSSLEHFNSREIFSLNSNFTGEIRNRTFVMSKYSDIKLQNSVIYDRIKLLNSITEPKSVKIHTFHFNEEILNWLYKQSCTVVWLERKDKLAAFKSLLIAKTLNQFVGPVTAKSVNVTLHDINYWYRLINTPVELINNIKSHIATDINYVFYEDMINDSYFDNKKSWVSRQFTTDVAIENWDDICKELGICNTV